MGRKRTTTRGQTEARESATTPRDSKRASGLSNRRAAAGALFVGAVFAGGLVSGRSLSPAQASEGAHASTQAAASEAQVRRGEVEASFRAPSAHATDAPSHDTAALPGAGHDHTAHAAHAPDAQPWDAADRNAAECAHGHGPGGPIDEKELERLQAWARTTVDQGPAPALEALRAADADTRSWIAGALIDDLRVLGRLEVVRGLAELAGDTKQEHDLRLTALELLGRSPGTDAEGLAALRVLAEDAALDPFLRAAALGSINTLATYRDDLKAETRTALLSAARSLPNAEQRAEALEGVRIDGASVEQLDQTAAYLSDSAPTVREAAARVLGRVDLERRADAVRGLRGAILLETDVAVAAAILASAVRVARGEADALLAELAQSGVVSTTPVLKRQAADYRALIAAGETDPNHILLEREAREQSRHTLADGGER